jgi:hypothetical protein
METFPRWFKFREWLFLFESQPPAAYLKQKYEKEHSMRLKQMRWQIKQHLPNMREDKQTRLVAYFLYNIIQQSNDDLNAAWKITSQFVFHLQTSWSGVLDYINAHIDDQNLWGKLVSTTYPLDQLKRAADEWHEELARRKKKPGAPGRVVIENIPGMPGFRWVSLDKGYCQDEGNAAGHCGNVGAKPGDNIYSLRDMQDKVYLTFIVNGKSLGESKANNNQKPAPRYHPAIIALLKSPYVEVIQGGGYAPENNFSLDDLAPDLKADLFKAKPDMALEWNAFLKRQIEKMRNDEPVDPEFTSHIAQMPEYAFLLAERMVKRNETYDEKTMKMLVLRTAGLRYSHREPDKVVVASGYNYDITDAVWDYVDNAIDKEFESNNQTLFRILKEKIKPETVQEIENRWKESSDFWGREQEVSVWKVIEDDIHKNKGYVLRMIFRRALRKRLGNRMVFKVIRNVGLKLKELDFNFQGHGAIVNPKSRFEVQADPTLVVKMACDIKNHPEKWTQISASLLHTVHRNDEMTDEGAVIHTLALRHTSPNWTEIKKDLNADKSLFDPETLDAKDVTEEFLEEIH